MASKSVGRLPHSPAEAVGEMFAANGFRLALREPSVGALDTGGGLLRLMKDLPLAMRVDAYLRSPSGAATPKVDLHVTTGAPKPKKHPALMLPMGGARLSGEELDQVVACVLGLSEAS